MKKKIAISVILAVCLILWGVRYYTFNGTFALHTQFPVEYHSMNETIVFDEDMMSYGMYYQPGYTMCLKSARVVTLEEYLEEIGKSSEELSSTSEKYVELTFDISNISSDSNVSSEDYYNDGLSLYAFPIIGDNWYTFFDGEITAYINEFEQEISYVDMVIVESGETVTLKVAYNLFSDRFLPKEFENIKDEDMRLCITKRPTEKYIKIELS